MELAKRLSTVVPVRSNRGCETCRWYKDLPAEDQKAFRDWIAEQRSLTQLWRIVTAMEPNPLQISMTGLRSCIRNHFKADE